MNGDEWIALGYYEGDEWIGRGIEGINSIDSHRKNGSIGNTHYS